MNHPNSASLFEALRAAGKQTIGAKKKFEHELTQHLPFLEKIMARTPAQDYDPLGDEDEDMSDETNVSDDIDGRRQRRQR